MREKTAVVNIDFEARSAALFVQLAGKFSSVMKISLDNKHTNCKSIMGMISLGIQRGSTLIISAEGEDAEQAVTELSNFFVSESN